MVKPLTGQVAEAYSYRFVEAFAESQDDRLDKVGKDLWSTSSISLGQTGLPRAGCPGLCPKGFVITPGWRLHCVSVAQ